MIKKTVQTCIIVRMNVTCSGEMNLYAVAQ